MSAADSNPFATRFTRPGAAAYIFPPDNPAERLVGRLRENGWWGQIVGPHGSGKSTLLAALTPAIEAHGRTIVRFSLAEKQRSLPVPVAAEPAWNGQTQVIVDGYEQLSWWSRRRLTARCWAAGAGLLVTAHISVGLPELFTTAPSVELAQAVVRQLLRDHEGAITPADVSAAYAQHSGNIRETLFQLYDLYQQRRRA